MNSVEKGKKYDNTWQVFCQCLSGPNCALDNRCHVSLWGGERRTSMHILENIPVVLSSSLGQLADVNLRCGAFLCFIVVGYFGAVEGVRYLKRLTFQR